MKFRNCFERSEVFFAPIPEFFYGKWQNSLLFTDCAHNERGARLMTRDEALAEALAD